MSNNGLEALQKRDQGLAVFARQGTETQLRLRGLAPVPEDGFGEVAGAAVVQVEAVAVDGGDEAQAPQRGGAPFAAIGEEVAAAVGQAFAHVVQNRNDQSLFCLLMRTDAYSFGPIQGGILR